jgi:hypothetical protein
MNAQGDVVIELTCASEFQSLWSMLLSHEKFTSEETLSHTPYPSGEF